MDEEKDFKQNTRECFRIEYPLGESAVFEADGRTYPVRNISEKGAKFEGDPTGRHKPGAKISGDIIFLTGDKIYVEGEVLRRFDPDEFVLVFVARVPLPTIVREQRLLIERYKHLL